MTAAFIASIAVIVIAVWLLTHSSIRWVRAQITAVEQRIEAKLQAARTAIVLDTVKTYDRMTTRAPHRAA